MCERLRTVARRCEREIEARPRGRGAAAATTAEIARQAAVGDERVIDTTMHADTALDAHTRDRPELNVSPVRTPSLVAHVAHASAKVSVERDSSDGPHSSRREQTTPRLSHMRRSAA